MKIHINTTSNIIKFPEIKKQIEDNLRDKLEKSIPDRLKRMGEIPSFITHEVGFYSQLLNEAEDCYESGLYYATISMIGIATERFCMELEEKIKLKINDNEIGKDILFGKKLKQFKRLDLLRIGKLINNETFDRLNKIKDIRDKYIHPSEIGDAKEDSLKILKLYIEILNSRFSDVYVIKEGKIVEKDVKEGDELEAEAKKGR